MMSSEPQLGQRRKGGMLDISDEDDRHPLFYPPFTKKHYPNFNVSVQQLLMMILVNLSSPVIHRNYMLWWISLFAVVIGVSAFHLAEKKADRTGYIGNSI
jgi:hypothetical protein